MGFNLSKGDSRFDLSKSSTDVSVASLSNASSHNVASDKTMLFVIVLTILVIFINASLWYHVITSPSNPVSSVKNVNVVNPVQ